MEARVGRRDLMRIGSKCKGSFLKGDLPLPHHLVCFFPSSPDLKKVNLRHGISIQFGTQTNSNDHTYSKMTRWRGKRSVYHQRDNFRITNQLIFQKF